MKYYIFTIGCQMNVSDAERIASVLENLGYQQTDKESEVDLICVVACSVRQSAIDRIYGRARKWQKIKKLHPLITILSGCVLDADKPKMAKIFDVIFEIKDLKTLPTLLNRHSGLDPESMDSARVYPVDSCSPFSRGQVYPCESRGRNDIRDRNDKKENPKQILNSKFKIQNSSDYLNIFPKHESPSQAYIPISTGCNNFCSYCVVPYTRGREISRPAEEIISEVRSLAAGGYKEITLLGQNVNSYGITKELNNKKTKKQIINFPDLLRKINDIPGDFWIRFLTSHPKDMSQELIKTIAECKKVTEYVHLPFQSGDDEILKKMNRHYTTEKYLKLVSDLRLLIPGLCLSTDVIVGFPGETKKQFESTVQLMKKAKFDMAYISQYSPRPGTAAYKLKDNVPKKEKEYREKVLNEILEKTALENNKKYIGKEVEVLVESNKSDRGNKGDKNLSTLSGRARTFKNIQFSGSESLVGKFTKVKVISCTPWSLGGELINAKDAKSGSCRTQKPQKRPLIVIVGPTASGKTELVVKLCKIFGGEVINADSRSIYKGMVIGTGSPTDKEKQGIPHHLFNFLEPDQEFSLALYQKMVKVKLKEIWDRGKIPFLVGGTGLYIDSVVYEYKIPEVAPNKKLRGELEKKSEKELMIELEKLDPDSVASIDPKNKRRLIRALEVCLTTQKPFSTQRKKRKLPQNVLIIGLDVFRQILYQKINERVEKMFKEGLIDEVKNLVTQMALKPATQITRNYKEITEKIWDLPSMTGIGYKELGEFLKNKISFEKAKEEIKKNTRNLAKRQITWFRRNKDIYWIKVDSKVPAQTEKQAEKLIKNFLK